MLRTRGRLVTAAGAPRTVLLPAVCLLLHAASVAVPLLSTQAVSVGSLLPCFTAAATAAAAAGAAGAVAAAAAVVVVAATAVGTAAATASADVAVPALAATLVLLSLLLLTASLAGTALLAASLLPDRCCPACSVATFACVHDTFNSVSLERKHTNRYGWQARSPR
jgi:hypothetical protein